MMVDSLMVTLEAVLLWFCVAVTHLLSGFRRSCETFTIIDIDTMIHEQLVYIRCSALFS